MALPWIGHSVVWESPTRSLYVFVSLSLSLYLSLFLLLSHHPLTDATTGAMGHSASETLNTGEGRPQQPSLLPRMKWAGT